MGGHFGRLGVDSSASSWREGPEGCHREAARDLVLLLNRGAVTFLQLQQLGRVRLLQSESNILLSPCPL